MKGIGASMLFIGALSILPSAGVVVHGVRSIHRLNIEEKVYERNEYVFGREFRAAEHERKMQRMDLYQKTALGATGVVFSSLIFGTGIFYRRVERSIYRGLDRIESI